MTKRKHEAIIVATIIVFTVLLTSLVLLIKAAGPTGLVASDLDEPLEITDFDAVFSPDGTVSFRFVAKADENIRTGLTGTFKIRGESFSRYFQYDADAFFSGAFGELQGIVGYDDFGEFELEDVSGVFVVTNAIDNTATVLAKVDFFNPLFRGGPFVSEDLIISLEYVTYDKVYKGSVFVPFSPKHVAASHYTAHDGFIEIDA